MINALLARLVRPEPGQGATSAVLKIASLRAAMLTRETHFGTNNEAVGRWWGSMRVQDVAASDQRRDQTMGHWRAISPGVARSMTVTGGASDDQVRAVRGPDLSDSQADSAGSIPVTRSNVKIQASGIFDVGFW